MDLCATDGPQSRSEEIRKRKIRVELLKNHATLKRPLTSEKTKIWLDMLRERIEAEEAIVEQMAFLDKVPRKLPEGRT